MNLLISVIAWMGRLSIYLITLAISAMLCRADAQQIQNEQVSPSDNGNLEIKVANPASEPFIVRSIFITGNKKTNASIILREIPFKQGDYFQLQQLVSKFEDARTQLMNTSLFHEVTV